MAGLDLFFQGDVRRILDTLADAGDLRGPDYYLALRHVALAFGVPVPGVPTSARGLVVDQAGALVEGGEQ